MNVIFVEPAFPHNQREFVRALASIGATVLGVGERPEHFLDDELRGWLSGYWQIHSVTDEQALYYAVRQVQDRVWVDRLESVVEAHIGPAARVRESCTIPGISTRTAWLCRDKVAMKEALRGAGVPCAQSCGVESLGEADDFAAKTGFPLIVKPRAGAGASGTERVDGRDELHDALRRGGIEHGASIMLEEFLEGHEGYIDTITVNGRVEHEFITHYYPGVLEAMRTRWIAPQMVSTNRVDSPGYDEVKAMTRRVIEVLGIDTAPTHMEWFSGPKGLKFSEIGCRPPGVCQWDVYCMANDIDLYREWALAVCHGRVENTPSRRFAGGMIAVRPDRDGRIAGYTGVDELHHRYGEHIVHAHLPDPGAPTQPVEAGYMANAWVRARHPDYDTLRAMLDDIGRTLQVHAH